MGTDVNWMDQKLPPLPHGEPKECQCFNCVDNRFYDGASTAPYTPKPCLWPKREPSR